DSVKSVLGLSASLGDHCHHRLTLPVHLVDCEGILGGRHVVGQHIQTRDPWGTDFSQFGTRDDPINARTACGGSQIAERELGTGKRTAVVGDMVDLASVDIIKVTATS